MSYVPTSVTIRIEDEMHEELLSRANAQGVTLSDLMRRALAETLNQGRTNDDLDRGGRAIPPATMTTLERHQLAMLHRVLARLVDGDGDDGDREHQLGLARILESGYVVDYEDVFISLEAELPRRDAQLVMDILEMFYFLEWSYNQLSDSEKDALGESTRYRVRFRGFDFNNRREARLHGFAKYLIDDGKWEDLAVYFDREHERGNSHMPMLRAYERMLEEFNPIWKERVRQMTIGGSFNAQLSLAEIRQITDAVVHPDNRGR